MFSWFYCPVGFKTKISCFIFGQFWNHTWSLYKMAFTAWFVPHRFIQLNIIYQYVIYQQCKKRKGTEPMSFNSVEMLKLLNCSHVLRIKLKFLFHFKPTLIYLQGTGFPYICRKLCVMTLFTEYFPRSKPAAWYLYRVLIIGNALVLFFTKKSLGK